MDAYELLPRVYRVPGGFGADGEIYGGIYIDSEPGILIGASGGLKFVKNLIELLSEKTIETHYRVYLPTVNWNEMETTAILQKKFDGLEFYIHRDIADEFENPRQTYLNRFDNPHPEADRFTRVLPTSLNNVIRISKAHGFETSNTKILVIPFQGPHKGHTFIYSRDHKILFSGIMLGLTSDPNYYYIDQSGSFFDYENGLSFLKQARSDIIVPAYDEPKHIGDSQIDIGPIQNMIEFDRENIFELTSLQWKDTRTLLDDYKTYYAPKINSEGWKMVNLLGTRLKVQLDKLVEDGKLIEKEGNYRRM